MSPVTVVVLLTLLLGVQPITTDLYLPALPTVQAVSYTHLTLPTN